MNIDKVTLICPACGSDKIQSGGFTGIYHWCTNCKDPTYSEAKDGNYTSFLAAGNMVMTAKMVLSVEIMKRLIVEPDDLSHVMGFLMKYYPPKGTTKA